MSLASEKVIRSPHIMPYPALSCRKKELGRHSASVFTVGSCRELLAVAPQWGEAWLCVAFALLRREGREGAQFTADYNQGFGAAKTTVLARERRTSKQCQNNATTPRTHHTLHCPHSHLRQLALPQRHAISDHFLHVVALGSRR